MAHMRARTERSILSLILLLVTLPASEERRGGEPDEAEDFEAN